jgi:predicted ATPase/DNA-binding CsgD family transcriptional regulator
MNPLAVPSASESGNLPAELSSFIGRASELARLVDELHGRTRLLTLVGPGGVGKTRLALRLGAMVRRDYQDGLWLVELAHVIHSAQVPQTVADALGVGEQAGRSWDETLAERLRTQHLLLILDNCEHVLERSSDLAKVLLQQCPGLRILATSRQPLGAPDERVWHVRPLESGEAVRLFVERAVTRAQEFRLSERNLRIVADICQRLDGLPLALELVAARVESMDLADIADRLESGLALRVSGHRSAPLRQQTLRATFDWSYALLDNTDQLLFRRLAVFASGWTLAAAQAICADAALPRIRVAKLLEGLASRSLVTVEHDGTSLRYRLLQTLREYAREQLDASEEAAILQQRHAAYMLELVELADPESLNVAHAAVLERERSELCAALMWALNRHDAEIGLRLAIGAHSFWSLRGRYSVGRRFLERLLALPEAAATRVRADAQRALALLLTSLGEYASAESYLHDALAQYESRGDRLGIAMSLRLLGSIAMRRGELVRARPLLTDAARRLHELGSAGELGALFNLGTVAFELGEDERALDLADQFEDFGRLWSQPLGLAGAVGLRALVAARNGASAEAEQLLREGLEIQESLEYQQWSIVLNCELGHALLDQGRGGEARAAFAEAIRGATDTGDRLRLARALEGVARAAASGQPTVAVRLAGAAAALRTLLGITPWPRDERRRVLWLPTARRELGERAYANAWSAGQAMSQDDARALAEAVIASRELDSARSSPLSPRETQVAILLARGRSTRQIAAEMVISVATVRVHVDHILGKLDLHSRTQVALWATQQGLLSHLG